MTPPLSQRLRWWETELLLDSDFTTLDKVKGIREEVEALEQRLEAARKWCKRIKYHRDGVIKIPDPRELEAALGEEA